MHRRISPVRYGIDLLEPGLVMSPEMFEYLVEHEPHHYEMIDSIVYNIFILSDEQAHDQIKANMWRLLEEQIGRNIPCRSFKDRLIAIPDHPTVRCDLVISCDQKDWDNSQHSENLDRIYSPRIVVEVVSDVTEEFDRNEKFQRYQFCPTLEAYILVEWDTTYVEVYRRATDWQMEQYIAGDTIKLEQLDLELTLEDIYSGVY